MAELDDVDPPVHPALLRAQEQQRQSETMGQGLRKRDLKEISKTQPPPMKIHPQPKNVVIDLESEKEVK